MELNKLVFPVPPPSYTHEVVNSGEVEGLEFLANGSATLDRSKPRTAHTKMLYVPKFELMEPAGGTGLMVTMNLKAASRRIAPSFHQPMHSALASRFTIAKSTSAFKLDVRCATDLAEDDYGP